MIIKPKVRGFICINAHPVGCAKNVEEQIGYVDSQKSVTGGPKNVLVLGSSTGYGLASRIVSAFGCGANTMGVFFEKPPTEKKTGSAGFYNAAAFDELARAKGLESISINGDAYSDNCKQQVAALIKEKFGQVDLVVYSLAAPRRKDPKTGELYSSVLKPVNQSLTAKHLNTDTLKISELTLAQASQEEIDHTIKVMGGEDWEMWIDTLNSHNVLSKGCQTVAYTYMGEKITWPIYGKATIGKAKEDLDRAAAAMTNRLSAVGGSAKVAVLKALVTQSSSAIPIMPLYISLLYKIMKDEGTHEGCIEQIYRLFTEGLYTDTPRLDQDNRLRMDNLELNPSTQAKIEKLWDEVTEDNLMEITDYRGYNKAFLNLFGFERNDLDYNEDVSPMLDPGFL